MAYPCSAFCACYRGYFGVAFAFAFLFLLLFYFSLYPYFLAFRLARMAFFHKLVFTYLIFSTFFVFDLSWQEISFINIPGCELGPWGGTLLPGLGERIRVRRPVVS